MISFRLSEALIRQHFRTIARKSSTATSAARSIVHQVYPFSNIKITSNYILNIKPYDILDCPDGNLLRISLRPKETDTKGLVSDKLTKLLSNFDASVQIDDQNIVIDTVDSLSTHVNSDELGSAVECFIEVPVKSNLKVSGKRDVNIQNMYSDDIVVSTHDGDVITKNIHSANLSLTAENGNIRCEGTTLAQKMDVRSHGSKTIHLNQVLGDSLTAISENGTISTNSCYAENSKFITQKGGFQLKNVHKKSELYLLDGGDAVVDVTGFHGILNATINGGILNFQLNEVYGDSWIQAQNSINFDLKISEFVEQHTCLAINAKEIMIDSTLNHFEKSRKCDENGENLITLNRDINSDSLTVQTKGNITLGKLSWVDSIKLKMTAQKPDTK